MMASLHETLVLQRAAFMAELPVPIAIRKDRLRRAAAMIADNAARFCDAMSEDFGHRSREQSMMTDIGQAVAPITHAIARVEKWARPESRGVEFPLGLLGARAQVEYQPKGVIGVIAPWNFPVQLVMGPLAGIFAAGNRAMVKTSEFTPLAGALFEDLCPAYFAVEELAFFSGGPDVGKEFAGLAFDHLLFTGATGIGKHILHAAADNLVPVTLELGGKSPVIVGASADIRQTTERVALGKMLNAGQICLAPDYMIVPADKEAAVVAGLKTAATAMYPTVLANPDYTSIVNDRHFQRLTDWLDDARAKGATVETVNPANEDFASSNARKMPLHIVTDVTDDMTLMQEEIFGPILPIRRYDGDIDEAIAQVNAKDRPLGLYYFGNDSAEQRRVLDRTISGGVTVNDVVFHVSMEELPFGGIGPSGMGAYHGPDGFKTFSHAKAVYRQPKIDVAKLAGLKPPYGKALMATVKRQLKI